MISLGALAAETQDLSKRHPEILAKLERIMNESHEEPSR